MLLNQHLQRDTFDRVDSEPALEDQENLATKSTPGRIHATHSGIQVVGRLHEVPHIVTFEIDVLSHRVTQCYGTDQVHRQPQGGVITVFQLSLDAI